MDIEPAKKVDRKTLELIKKGEIEASRPSEEKVNRSTIFEFLYFWTIFILSASFFADLTLYFIYYQDINNQLSYHSVTYILRIIADSLFILPLLIYIRIALTNNTKNYVIGIFVFLPQLILCIVTIVLIYTQDFITQENLGINKNEANFFIFLSSNSSNSSNSSDTIDTSTDFPDSTDSTDSTDFPTLLTNAKVVILKISPIINLFFYILAIVLTYLKIIKNF